MLFAQTDPLEAAKYGLYGVLCVAIGVGGKYLLDYLLRKMAVGVADDKVAIREYGKIVARQELRIAKVEETSEADRRELDKVKQRESKCWRKFERIKAAMENYEGALTQAKIPFKPINLSDLDSRDDFNGKEGGK